MSSSEKHEWDRVNFRTQIINRHQSARSRKNLNIKGLCAVTPLYYSQSYWPMPTFTELLAEAGFYRRAGRIQLYRRDDRCQILQSCWPSPTFMRPWKCTRKLDCSSNSIVWCPSLKTYSILHTRKRTRRMDFSSNSIVSCTSLKNIRFYTHENVREEYPAHRTVSCNVPLSKFRAQNSTLCTKKLDCSA